MSSPAYRLAVAPRVTRDVAEQADHIARGSFDASLRFVRAAYAAFQETCSSPYRWPEFPTTRPRLIGLRKRSVPGFGKHLIFYRVQGNTVRIVRVLHGARDLPTVLSRA